MPKNKSSSSEGVTQVSLSLPTELIERIDELAKAENRNRSNYIATFLKRIAEAHGDQSSG